MERGICGTSLHLKRHILQHRLSLHFENHWISRLQGAEDLPQLLRTIQGCAVDSANHIAHREIRCGCGLTSQQAGDQHPVVGP